MSRERRDLISDLYHRALARAPEERAAFLIEACNGDDGLRQEVESLLAYESAVGAVPRDAGGAGAASRRERSDDHRQTRALHDRGAARRRRHGRGLSRPRQQARSRRGDQDPAVTFHRRSRAPLPLRARSADARDTQSSAHRRDLRARRIRRHDRAGPRAGRGTDAGRSPRTRSACRPRCPRHCAADRRGARGGARERDRPPRFEAGQHRAARARPPATCARRCSTSGWRRP